MKSKKIFLICGLLAVISTLYAVTIFQKNNRDDSTIKRTPNRKIDIQKAMDYPLSAVIERYQQNYNVSLEDAKKHERELKRYLIMCAESDTHYWMFSPEIDNLWHTFILFTKEYEFYCKEILGKFIHHNPRDPHEQA